MEAKNPCFYSRLLPLGSNFEMASLRKLRKIVSSALPKDARLSSKRRVTVPEALASPQETLFSSQEALASPLPPGILATV